MPLDSKSELVILYKKKCAEILGKSLSINTNYDDYIINKWQNFKKNEFITNKKVMKKADIYLKKRKSNFQSFKEKEKLKKDN